MIADYSFHLARMPRDVDEATRAFAARDWQRAADICLRISTAAVFARVCAEREIEKATAAKHTAEARSGTT